MAKWTKAEEGYFADSFNRDSICAYADAGISKTIAFNDWDGATSLAKGEYCVTTADVCSFTDPIVELQKKVKALELAIKQPYTKALRHYDRKDFLTLGG